MANNEKILLIDLSYCCFYRFYSTKKWYGLSHPEVDLKSIENWKEIPEFLDKFSKMFLNAISNLKKKYNIKWDNIIIIKDCHRKDIWRMDLFKDYKGTREAMHKKQGFNGGELFKHTYDTLIPEWIKNYNMKVIRCDRAEADDVIAILTKFLKNKKIYIVANDNDYLQLCDDRVSLIDMKGTNKSLLNKEFELWKKILVGDVSDNIPTCYISREYIKNNITSDCEKFLKCTSSVFKKIFNNEFLTLIDQKPTLVRGNQHLINRRLIDFEYIPENIKTAVIKRYNELYN